MLCGSVTGGSGGHCAVLHCAVFYGSERCSCWKISTHFWWGRRASGPPRLPKYPTCSGHSARSISCTWISHHDQRTTPVCLMADVAKLRFLIVHQVMQEGLDAGELEGGDAASLSLIFCCIMDQHINVLARMPKPKKRLTTELADSLVDVFLFGVGSGKRGRVSLPPFAADQQT
jgi:hypothetical protein